MENTSGGGKNATVPAEIDRWNWGAFLLNWIWGIGNNTYIAFLMFIPFVNMVMPFILGAKGGAWAWRNRRWESVEAFQKTQRKWTMWSLVVYAVLIAAFVGLFFAISAAMKQSDAYQMIANEVRTKPEVVHYVGLPIKTGAPTGSFDVSGPDGSAQFEFSVEGPQGSGTVYSEAEKRLGQWKITAAVFEDGETKQRVDIVKSE